MTTLTVINHQPVEKADYHDDGSLEIVDTWFTIQGEGPFAGEPAVFIRLAGCNLSDACKFCDTDYTSNRQRTSVAHILQKVSAASWTMCENHICKLVVITGGEPFRQNIAPLVDELIHLGYRVQIETNGTLQPPGNWTILGLENLTIVCSPKTGKVNPRIQRWIDCLKYVVEAGKVDPKDGLPTDSLGAGVAVQRPWHDFDGQVFIQPLDEQDPERNKAHMAEAVNSCTKFGYRLSVQLHKLAGLA